MADKSEARSKRKGLLMKRSARKAKAEGSSNKSDYRKQIQSNKRASNKKGCSTKLFMLVLPLVTAGAYLFLVS